MVTATTHKTLIEELFRAVDTSDYAALMAIFHPAIVYERPGYAPCSGLDQLMHFYKDVRVIGSGKHIIEKIVADGDYAACWGQFMGVKKTGESISERFADVY